MYGDALVNDYVRITSGDEAAFNDAVRRWNISWVIVPHRSHLVELLDRSAGWRRLASDEAGVVFVRRAP
jgi:hypothetical protein